MTRRAIRALLRAARSSGTFGYRARVTLWLPIGAYPSPCPAVPRPLLDRLGAQDEDAGGAWRWVRRGVAGETVVSVGKVWGDDPRGRFGPGDDPPLFPHMDEGGDWEWYTARATVIVDGARTAHTPLEVGWYWLADVASSYRDRCAWESDVGRLAWASRIVREAFRRCVAAARSTEVVHGYRRAGVAFAVKCYPGKLRSFASAAHRLLRALRAEGVRARLSAY